LKPQSTDCAKDSAGQCAEAVVRLYQKNLRPDALELDDVFAAQLAAVQADVVGANAGRERLQVQQLGIEPADLQP